VGDKISIAWGLLDLASGLLAPGMLAIAIMTAQIAAAKPNENLSGTNIYAFALNCGENFD
jgi:hypothetical protein